MVSNLSVISTLILCPLSSCTRSPGSKAAAVEFSNSTYDLDSPVSAGPLQVVQLAEDLRHALELQPDQEGRDSLRAQLPTETAQALMDWLQTGTVSTLHAVLQISFHLSKTFFLSYLSSGDICSLLCRTKKLRPLFHIQLHCNV